MVAQVEYSTQLDTLNARHSQHTPVSQVFTYTFDALPLQNGGQLDPVTLAYETWGSLNAEADNAVLITHALTGNRTRTIVSVPMILKRRGGIL